MTSKEAQQRSVRLKWILTFPVADARDWLALCEDELRLMFADRPELLARFAELKKEATTTNNSQRDANALLSPVKRFLDDVRSWLDSEPLTAQGLDEKEIERIFLKSRLVQIPLVLILVLLSLITGVWSLKLRDQFNAGQALLQDAKKQMQDSNIEVTKARAETNNREAELALFILQGNEKMVTMQTAAINQMKTEGEQFKKDVGDRAAYWVKQVDDVGPDAKKQVTDAGSAGASTVTEKTASTLQEFDTVLKGNKKTLQDKLAETIKQLEAARHPWIPQVIIWSFAKSWVFVAFAVLSSLLALGGIIPTFWKDKRGLAICILAILSALVIGLVLLLLLG